MTSSRFNILIIFICIVGLSFIVKLYDLQIVNGQSYLEQSEKRLVREVAIKAPRGEIYDRYGKLIVTNEIGYDLCLYYTKIEKVNLNKMLLKATYILEKNGDEYINNFPVNFEENTFKKSEESMKTWKINNKIKEDATVEEVIEFYKNKYEIKSDDIEEIKRIIPMRYEIATKGYTSYKSVTLAKEISIESMLEIEERNNEFSGINISKYPKRKYVAGNIASHILGYTGAISSTEYNSKKDEGYSQNDIIGKSGIESTFEELLKGEDGKSRLEMDSKGRITGKEDVIESKMGDSVVLTIDLDLQRKAEEVLEKYIKRIQNGGFSEKFADAKAGALVVLDVKTSEVLAMASYPSYNPEEFTDGINNSEYEKYFENSDRPMYNRAIQGLYSPGSTFKMVTAIAGLESGAVGINETIYDKGKYDKAHKPVCWIYSSYRGSHGNVDAETALKVSCNYYFYEIAYRMGIDTLSEYVKKFGLGVKTGIELIGEATGVIASREYLNKLSERDGKNRVWMIGDTLSAAIGQSYNSFTPIQMAYYIATLANGGVKNEVTILKEVISSDGEEIKRDEVLEIVDNKIGNTKVEIGDLGISKETIKTIFAGMKSVTSDRGGTAYSTFSSFPIEVAGKTGTATASSGSPNAWFVGFAPYDNPQIAVVCVIEHGGHGSYTAPAVKEVMEEYFGYNNNNIDEDLTLKRLNDIIQE